MTEEVVRVPRRLLAELAQCLEQQDEEWIEVPENGTWSQTMVRQLRNEIERYSGAVAVGDLAAQRAGTPVSIQEAVTESGIDKKQISSDLGAMSKAARRLFGKPRWPFRALDSTGGMTYLMQRDIAEWWAD